MGSMRGNGDERLGWEAGEGNGYDEGERGRGVRQPGGGAMDMIFSFSLVLPSEWSAFMRGHSESGAAP